MTITVRNVAIAVLLFAVTVFHISATDITLDLTVGNQDFSSRRTPGENEAVSTPTLVGLGFFVHNELTDGLFVDVGIERDAVLGNTVLSQLRVEQGVFKVTIGPTFGILNTSASPVRAGIAGTIELDVWDRVIVQAAARETLASLSDSGDYRSGKLSGILGLRVPNALVAAQLASSRFERIDSDDVLRRLSRMRYGASVDIYKQGVPYSVALDIAYVRRRSATTPETGSGDTTADVLGSVAIGGELSVEVSPQVRSYIGLNSNLFTFGAEELAGTDYSDTFLYTLNTGVRIMPTETD